MTQPRTMPRLMVAIPLALVFGVLALVATSLMGWSLDVSASPIERSWDDKWLLIISTVTGAATGALLAWGLTSRAIILLGAALVGAMPAVLKASAYFTDAY